MLLSFSPFPVCKLVSKRLRESCLRSGNLVEINMHLRISQMSLRVLLLQTEVEADRGGVHQVAARREHEKEELVSRGRMDCPPKMHRHRGFKRAANDPKHSFGRAMCLVFETCFWISGVPLTGNKLALARRSVHPKCCVRVGRRLLAAHLKFEPPLPTLLLSLSLSLSLSLHLSVTFWK